ncbi:MAG: hypothetical protein LBG06_05870 [Deltaproteobacteria bacterium]|nr:hypothetical protein [Deltaproteobacteria bacterium]
MALWAAGAQPGQYGSPAFPGPGAAPALAAASPAPGGPGAPPEDAARQEERLRKIVQKRGIQTELPLREPRAPSRRLEPPRPPASLAKVATALVLGGCVAFAVILISRRLRSRKEAWKPGPAPARERPRRELDRALLGIRDDADALAARGLFGEAVHALLLNGLEAFRRRDRDKVAPHLTSRELLPALPLNPVEDEALRELVFRSESAWFGGLAPGPGDYKAARASFGRLLRSVSPAAARAASGTAAGPQASPAPNRPPAGPSPAGGGPGAFPGPASVS